jgi:hypothetical protein
LISVLRASQDLVMNASGRSCAFLIEPSCVALADEHAAGNLCARLRQLAATFAHPTAVMAAALTAAHGVLLSCMQLPQLRIVWVPAGLDAAALSLSLALAELNEAAQPTALGQVDHEVQARWQTEVCSWEAQCAALTAWPCSGVCRQLA